MIHQKLTCGNTLGRLAVKLCKQRRANMTVATMGATDARQACQQLQPACHNPQSGISVSSLTCGGNILATTRGRVNSPPDISEPGYKSKQPPGTQPLRNWMPLAMCLPRNCKEMSYSRLHASDPTRRKKMSPSYVSRYQCYARQE
eukprot:1157290-Pelagomonas_calceolata.AAC.1